MNDWDPASAASWRDPIAAVDDLRERCPVAHSRQLGWSVFWHADVTRVLHDPELFSNRVSTHLSVPNGIDPPEHTAYRRAVEAPFAVGRIAAFEPTFRHLAAEVVEGWREGDATDFVATVARPFAARVQCAFLGWPDEAHTRLLQWTARSQVATAAGDREAQAALGVAFGRYVHGALAARPRDAQPADATTELLAACVDGEPLTDDELVSVLRNWTVGEVGTIAAAVAIVAGFLAQKPELQEKLKVSPALLPEAIEEILRLCGPLASNRRVATQWAWVRGRHIAEGERLSLMWTAANRDGRVFPEPTQFRWGRDPEPNLLYGAGIHACPGAPLARLELRVVTEALLTHTTLIEPGQEGWAEPARWPAAGWKKLFLRAR